MIAITRRVTISVGVVCALGLGLTLAVLGIMSTRPQVINAAGPILYVAPSGSDTTACTNSASPCRTIQYAVDQADPGAAIRVATGVYTGVNARPRNDVFSTGVVTQVAYVSKTVAIRGGYTTTNWTTSYPITQPTTLDAQGQGRVLYIAGDISSTIEGLRITRGDAVGLGGGQFGVDSGGGIYVITAAATISDNRILANTAGDGGGVHLAQGSVVTVTGNAIISNVAVTSGGGIHVIDGDASIIGNNIAANEAHSGNAGQGGAGLFLYSSNVAITGNVITSNTTASIGGGLYILGGKVMLDDNVIMSNTAVTGGGLGGGGGTLSGNTFVANKAEIGGGLAIGDRLTLDGDIIISNAAMLGGGGFASQNGDAVFTNTIVADNATVIAGSGGLFLFNSTLRLLHGTIARNRGGDGSGIYLNGSSSALTNTILVSQAVGISVAANSTATLQGTLWGSGAWANGMDWSGDGTIITGTVNVWGDPAFVNPSAGDYHIGAGSAARDAGVNAGVNVDLDGDPRPLDAGYDIGADEFEYRRLYLPVVLRQFP